VKQHDAAVAVVAVAAGVVVAVVVVYVVVGGYPRNLLLLAFVKSLWSPSASS
jgi:hypothetical protein